MGISQAKEYDKHQNQAKLCSGCHNEITISKNTYCMIWVFGRWCLASLSDNISYGFKFIIEWSLSTDYDNTKMYNLNSITEPHSD